MSVASGCVLVLVEHFRAFPLSKDTNPVSGPLSSPADAICTTVLELFSFLLLTQEIPQRFAGPTPSRVHRLQCGLGGGIKGFEFTPLQQLLLMFIFAETCSVWFIDLWGFYCEHCLEWVQTVALSYQWICSFSQGCWISSWNDQQAAPQPRVLQVSLCTTNVSLLSLP